MDNYFNKNIKFIREKRKLSQNKFGELLGVNQSTVKRWEDEDRIPTIDSAIEVSRKLSIPLNVLVGKDLSSDDTDYLSNIADVKLSIKNLPSSEMNNESKESLINMIDTLHNLSKKD